MYPGIAMTAMISSHPHPAVATSAPSGRGCSFFMVLHSHFFFNATVERVGLRVPWLVLTVGIPALVSLIALFKTSQHRGFSYVWARLTMTNFRMMGGRAASAGLVHWLDPALSHLPPVPGLCSVFLTHIAAVRTGMLTLRSARSDNGLAHQNRPEGGVTKSGGRACDDRRRVVNPHDQVFSAPCPSGRWALPGRLAVRTDWLCRRR